MASPYSILGVPEGASLDVCKSAYRDLSKKFHPDSGGDARQFAVVTSAWNQIKTGSVTLSVHRGVVTHNSVFSFRKAN